MQRVPHTSGLRVGVLEGCNAEGTQALLRAGASPFSDVQLLPAAAALGDSAGQICIRHSAGKNSRALSLSPVGYVVMPEHV